MRVEGIKGSLSIVITSHPTFSKYLSAAESDSAVIITLIFAGKFLISFDYTFFI